MSKTSLIWLIIILVVGNIVQPLYNQHLKQSLNDCRADLQKTAQGIPALIDQMMHPSSVQ